MSHQRTLKQSLIISHLLVGFIPLVLISALIIPYSIHSIKEDFTVRIGLLSEGTQGQIDLFLAQPAKSLETVREMIQDPFIGQERITAILNTNVAVSSFFDSILLLDEIGTVIHAGLPQARERYRNELLGISLGHKESFRLARRTGTLQWSNTFLSLSSERVSLTLFLPAGPNTLAADINLNALSQAITRLSRDNVITFVIDRNGAIIIHPDPSLVGNSIMMNNVSLVTEALQGTEQTGEFSFQGTRYLGSTRIIDKTGWVSLFAEPVTLLHNRLSIPMFIISGGIFGAIILSLLLAWYKARTLATPITEVTEQSGIIARGDYSCHLPEQSLFELSKLSQSINDMAASIREREAALRENEEQYRELVEGTSNMVLRLDETFTIIYANHTVSAILGIPQNQVINHKLDQFMTPEEWSGFAQHLHTWIRQTARHNSIELKLTGNDGFAKYLLMTVNLHYTDLGAYSDMNIVAHDITTRYELEQKKREVERRNEQHKRLELMGIMAGGVAHDLNNILAGIINYPELMLLKLAHNDPMRSKLEAIQQSGKRAVAVVADLLTVARRSAIVHEITDINDLIEGFLQTPEFDKITERFPEVNYSFVAARDLWYASCSPVHIGKVLLNLVLNAFESMPSGGQALIRTKNITPAELATTTVQLPPNRYIRIDIKDSGQGIPLDSLDKIFEPFFTKKVLGKSGTGLGLTIALTTVEEHGGTITVDSGDWGTEFSVYLPAAEDRRLPEQGTEDLNRLFGHQERILVVDDEEHLRDITLNMLQVLNYQAEALPSGEEAVRYLQDNTVDMVLLDMLMPPGINGQETYERIRLIHPNQKALIISGYSESDSIEAALDSGAALLLKKPFTIHQLGQAIHDILTH